MTTQAPEWFVEKYRSQVLHKYQSKGNKLIGTVTPPSRIDGKSMHFPIAGIGEAQPLVQGDDLKPMNADREDKEVIPSPYQAPEYIYQVNLDRMNANEMDAAIMTGAWALGRQHDQIVVDALVAANADYGPSIGAYTDPWTLDNALEACDALQNNDVPWDGQVYAPLPSRAWNQLLTYDQFNSSDYVGPDLPFTKVTDRKTWNGVHWFLMENKRLPLNNNDRDFYIYHRSAIGAGHNGASLNVRITWENPKTAWLVNQWMDFGSTVLLPEGVVRCLMKNDSPITVT